MYDYYAWLNRFRAVAKAEDTDESKPEPEPEKPLPPLPPDHESGMHGEIVIATWRRKQRRTAEFIRWRYRNGDYVDDDHEDDEP